MFDKIITVTLNPSIDATYWLDSLDFVEPVGCNLQKDYPGGKGINVSRVLTSLGVSNTAVGITGRENMLKLSRLLDAERVCYDFVENEGSIRENLSIIFPDSKMLKINCKGFFVSREILEQVYLKIGEAIGTVRRPLLVFAGSLPKNVSKDLYKELVLHFKQLGSLIALDNDIFSSEDLSDISPFIIKPNHVELAHMFDLEELSKERIFEHAQKLARFTEHVIVSLSGDGLLYCNKQSCFKALVPNIIPKSTIGAGDSTLVGFIASLDTGLELRDCIRYAAACGTASVLLPGTETILPNQADAVFENVSIV